MRVGVNAGGYKIDPQENPAGPMYKVKMISSAPSTVNGGLIFEKPIRRNSPAQAPMGKTIRQPSLLAGQKQADTET
jgi:hypothetical protein